MTMTQTRRRFLTELSLAGAAGVLSPRCAGAAEPPPETTTVRLAKEPVICFAPQYVCEQLLRAEGFAEIRYVDIAYRQIRRSSAAAISISPRFCLSITSSASIEVRRLQLSPACMAAVTSCSSTAPFAPSPT